MSLDCTSVRSPLKHRISAVCRVFGFAMALFVISLSYDSTAYAKYASFVIDADTGQVLHGTNQDTRNYPASLTKMMTLYLIFERLEDKRWTLKTPLKVSRRAAAQPASKLGAQGRFNNYGQTSDPRPRCKIGKRCRHNSCRKHQR